MEPTAMDRRPYPITTATGAAGAVSTLVALLVLVGIVPSADADALSRAAGAAITAGFALASVVATVAAHHTAKSKTTPVTEPMAEVRQPDGSTALEPLVPVSLAMAMPPAPTPGTVEQTEPGPYDHI